MKKYLYFIVFTYLCIGGESVKGPSYTWTAIAYTFIDPTESTFLIEPPYDTPVNLHDDSTRHLKDLIKKFQFSQDSYCILLLDAYLMPKEIFWQYLEQFVLLCTQEKIPYKIGLVDESRNVEYILYFIAGDCFTLIEIKQWNNIEVWENRKKITTITSLEGFEDYLANKTSSILVIHLDDPATEIPQKFVEFISILNSQSSGKTFKFPYRLYFKQSY